MKTRVTLRILKELLNSLDKENIKYVVIAGFGLDGHRGYQTRPHQDVDIICLKMQARKIKRITVQLGYEGKWFGNLYKIKRKDGAKADLAMACLEGNELVTYGRIATTRFPRKLFKHQIGKIGNFKFKIAPNEILKTFALHATKGEDKKYANKIRAGKALMKKIHRVLKTQPQTEQQQQGHE